jgi:hypothetical protein
MGVKDIWKKALSPSKTHATFSAKILNYYALQGTLYVPLGHDGHRT